MQSLLDNDFVYNRFLCVCFCKWYKILLIRNNDILHLITDVLKGSFPVWPYTNNLTIPHNLQVVSLCMTGTFNLHRGHQSGPVMESQLRGSPSGKHLLLVNNGETRYRFQWKSLKSLGPSDAIWCWRSGSTLVQVMACCLTAPSHYVNQCWFIITKVQWHSAKGNFPRDTPSITTISLQITYLKFHAHLPGTNELIVLLQSMGVFSHQFIQITQHCDSSLWFQIIRNYFVWV